MCSGRSTIWYFEKYEPFNVGYVCVQSCHCKTEYVTVSTGHPETLGQRERAERALLCLFRVLISWLISALRMMGIKWTCSVLQYLRPVNQRLSQVSQSHSAPKIVLMPPSQLLSGKWGALRPAPFLTDPGSLATNSGLSPRSRAPWDLGDDGRAFCQLKTGQE